MRFIKDNAHDTFAYYNNVKHVQTLSIARTIIIRTVHCRKVNIYNVFIKLVLPNLTICEMNFISTFRPIFLCLFGTFRQHKKMGQLISIGDLIKLRSRKKCGPFFFSVYFPLFLHLLLELLLSCTHSIWTNLLIKYDPNIWIN